MSHVQRVFARHSDSLLAKPGVQGVMIGYNKQRRPVNLLVFLRSNAHRRGIPKEIEGCKILINCDPCYGGSPSL